jgi:hypothetical protein
MMLRALLLAGCFMLDSTRAAEDCRASRRPRLARCLRGIAWGTEKIVRRSARWTEGETLHLTYTLQSVREQLADLVETIPSGHDLPAFRAASGLLIESG